MKTSHKVIHKVGAIILDENNRMLAVHKRDKPARQLIVPGGKIDKNETHEEALRRELREELRVELNSYKEFGVYSAEAIYEPGTQLIMYVYVVSILGEPVPSEEIDAIVWLDANYATSGYEFASILGKKILPALFQREIHEGASHA